MSAKGNLSSPLLRNRGTLAAVHYLTDPAPTLFTVPDHAPVQNRAALQFIK